MPYRRLQHLSAEGFSAFRRLLARSRAWIQTRPRLAAWFYPKSTPESQYREFNAWYFTDFFQQEKMLADRPRMEFYRAAIARHIRPGDRVVDLGTGTGILAALASRQGASKVYAIDHSEILEHAKTLAQANGIENVDFVATHSKKFTVDRPVDVIVHEQMGDCLFDEDMVANVTDLRDRVLKPGGLILPSRFELYCDPIMVKDKHRAPFLWELNVCGYDYSSLERSRPQDPAYYRLRSGDPGMIGHFLCETEPALSFDLQTVVEAQMPHELNFKRTVVRGGRLDGYAIYFRARVDGGLCLSTSPLDAGRAPHWGFRILRTDRDTFEAGDEIEIKLTVGLWPDVDTWRWSHVKHPAEAAQAAGGALLSDVGAE